VLAKAPSHGALSAHGDAIAQLVVHATTRVGGQPRPLLASSYANVALEDVAVDALHIA
jgi:hypothetical protein